MTAAHRQLGGTGLHVSSLCLGTMSFGGDADEAEARRMYDACRAVGIDTFDCADVYNGGQAEVVLGRLIREERDDVVITTKAYFPTGSGPHHRGLSRRYLSNAIEASLRRLDTECVDIFFLHRFDDDTPLDETLRAAEDAVRSGKIRYLGVSNFSAWQTMKAAGVAASLGTSPIAAVQPMYNLVKRQAEVEILPMAADAGFGVMPYSPLGGGLLAGRYGGRRRPESGRLIDNPMYATRYGADGYYATASRFCALAEECDVHPAALAVAWVAAHPAVTAPIIGARNIEQLGAVLGALSIEMTSDLWSRIGALTPQPPPATDRNEEVSSFNYDRMLR